jgi:dsDNA-specific endonuclease/ATPase MutS2
VCVVSSIQLPRFDAFMMRMSNADSPADGLSAFAMEMIEVGDVVKLATENSLVMLDEMGKGTEPDQVRPLIDTRMVLPRARAPKLHCTHGSGDA